MWDTPERRRDLLCELVGWDSVTGTPGERAFAGRVASLLEQVAGIEVETHAVEGERAAVTALWRASGVADTVVLVSHFDTVDTIDYGPLRHHAGDPDALADALARGDIDLDEAAAADLASGEWLWGRGAMDMKAGLALHMSLIERAAAERLPLNLLLLTVPDEEVNSAGMRAGVLALRELQVRHELRYVLFLNGEPSFPAFPGDTTHHIYSGSIGKLLPAALCRGRETHAGTPLAGITSSWIASYLTRAMEWNDAFRETVHGEATQLPVTLEQRDLRDGYSTQTPFRTTVLFNVFVMAQGADDVLERFEQVTRGAAAACMADYRAMCDREHIEPLCELRVIRFEELETHARSKLGEETVQELTRRALERAGDDLREQSIAIADDLLGACLELAPAIVVMFAPPYYPAVCSSGDELVEACVERVIGQASDRFGSRVARTHWFNGISDLSYVCFQAVGGGHVYARNSPGFGATYDIPFEAIAALDAPVLNVGPLGKDPHQRTERVHAASALEELPLLLWDLVSFVAARA